MRTVIFVHIPKTAGTAMMNALRRSIGKRYVHHAGPRTQLDALRNMPRDERDKFKIFGAHMSAPELYGLFGPDAYYFTVVREPVSRILSLASHLARKPEHREHQYAVQGLDAWLDYLERTPDHLWLAHQRYFVQPDANAAYPDFLNIFDGKDVDAVIKTVTPLYGGYDVPVLRLNASENKQPPTSAQVERIKAMFAADFELAGHARPASA